MLKFVKNCTNFKESRDSEPSDTNHREEKKMQKTVLHSVLHNTGKDVLHDEGEVKGKVHPITCHESTNEVQRYSTTLSLTLGLDGCADPSGRAV